MLGRVKPKIRKAYRLLRKCWPTTFKSAPGLGGWYLFGLKPDIKAFREINQQKESIMNKSNLKLSITVVLAVLLLFTTVNGYWSYNKSCTAFPNQCEEPGDKNLTVAPNLGRLIIDAAGFYLRSTSDWQLLLREIELSGSTGTNFLVLDELLMSAISNLELANSTYFQLWQASTYLEYDPIVLDKLRKFNYNKYQAKNHLHAGVFKQVSEFLKKGDIRGSYKKAYLATGELLERMKALNSTRGKHTLPNIPACWRLNQLFLETALFGQYVAEVFFALE
jgi:hypothetical protein